MADRYPLDQIEIPHPCPADWDKMVGDNQTRFCSHCDKHVHNLSAMSRTDAERLVCESAGELCVQFARDRNGDVITLDYSPSEPAKHQYRLWGLLIGVAATAMEMIGLNNTRTTVRGGMVCRPTPFPSNNAATQPAGSDDNAAADGNTLNNEADTETDMAK